MAQATKQRPGRSLAGIALFIVVLYVGMILGPSSTPALGLDLRGGTQVTLTAEPLNGKAITKGALNQAVEIIRKRVNGLGVAGADINTQGSNHIIVSVPGKKNRDKIVSTVGQTALLRFRQVLQIGSFSPTPTSTVSPSVSVSPGNGSATPKSTPKASTKPKKKSSGDALTSALLGKATATPTPTPSATPSTSPGATPSVSPSASESTSADAADNTPLPGSQAPTLTDQLKTSFLTWDCAKNPNPTRGSDDPDDFIIACDPSDGFVALLGPSTVQGTDVKSADAGLSTNGVGWQVNLAFTGSGSGKWLDITKKAYNATSSGDSGFQAGCAPPKGCNAVAIVLDGQVQSAPAIQSAGGIPGGIAQITGNFNQTDSTNLANVLKYGSLPLKFTKSDVTTVSATLGSKQLRGGLIAGAIGLALVILFSLLYYRALGLVTVGSLAVSGAILYAVTTLLGHSSLGYTLSLPGIAGFIVAVGITADSFVVYFERLRDEIREGKRMRSAVERSWPRARRTILSADTVSLLAAFVLYVVSIGDVRGFAFTLGLSTLSDLLIVFFFTRPLLQVLARRKAFDSAKPWTGIGKPRAGATKEDDIERPTRRVRGTGAEV